MILSTPCDQILAAFAECRRLVVDPKKNKNNTRSNYADLTAVADAINPALNETDLVIIQCPTHKEYQSKDILILETILIHTPSGQTMTFETQIPLAKNDAQGFGSTNTYARRYAKMSIFDLNATDDDGVKAIKTASDWKREIMAAGTVEEMDAIGRQASERFANDKASLQIVRDAYAQAKAKLAAKDAVPFNPADTANGRRGKASRVNIEAQNSPQQPPAEPRQPESTEGDFGDF